jgi:hypothetical protein
MHLMIKSIWILFFLCLRSITFAQEDKRSNNEIEVGGAIAEAEAFYYGAYSKIMLGQHHWWKSVRREV